MQKQSDKTNHKRKGTNDKSPVSQRTLPLSWFPITFGGANVSGRIRHTISFQKPKKYHAVLCILLCITLAACFSTNQKTGGKEPTPNIAAALTATPSPSGGEGLPLPTKAPPISPVPKRDLEGFEILIGDCRSPENPQVPGQNPNPQESYLARLAEDYHFTIATKRVADWETMEAVCMDSIRRGEPAAQVFALDYRFIGKPLSQGMFYDLAALGELDFDELTTSGEYKWNQNVRKIMTKGASVYGMSAEASVPQGGLIWNKQLFAEAGIDPNLPYQLQREGKWTWSEFEALCERLTRDTNGDGVPDVYATASQNAELLQCLVSSTGKDFFAVDENGRLSNNCRDKDVLGAMEFAASLYRKGYEKPHTEGSDNSRFVDAFQTGEAAMTFCREPVCSPKGAYYGVVEDVGFVLPPKPDGQEACHSYVCDTVYIIPSCYDAETAGKIAFGYNLYAADPDAWFLDEPDAWLNRYYSHFPKDEYAVDESIHRFEDEGVANFLVSALLPEGGFDKNGLNLDSLLGRYPFTDTTPDQCVNEIWDAWQKVLDELNGIGQEK